MLCSTTSDARRTPRRAPAPARSAPLAPVVELASRRRPDAPIPQPPLHITPELLAALGEWTSTEQRRSRRR